MVMGRKTFIKEFTNKNWSLSSVKKLLTNSDQTGTVDRKPGSDKKCAPRISQNIDSVEELVLSQESAPGTHTFVRLRKIVEFPKRQCIESSNGT